MQRYGIENKRSQKREGSEFLTWGLLAIGVGVEGGGGGVVCMGVEAMVKVEKEGAISVNLGGREIINIKRYAEV